MKERFDRVRTLVHNPARMAKQPKKPSQVGRSKEIETEEWAHLPFRIPRDLMTALENYLWDHGKRKKVPFIRDELLEKLLVDKGYLVVHTKPDSRTGKEVKRYEAVSRQKSGRARKKDK